MDLPEIFEIGFEEAERGEAETNEELTDSLISVSKKEIEKAIVSYIAGKYGIPETEISVETGSLLVLWDRENGLPKRNWCKEKSIYE